VKIIILGAGRVGSGLARNLASEANNDVVVVDHDPQLLQELQTKLDIATIAGNAAHPDILHLAGAEDADMIIAVTSRDENNMIACQIAWSLYKTPVKIARVRASEYLKHEKQLFTNENIALDAVISPEWIVTQRIKRLIQHPGTLQVLDFAGGRVRLIAVRTIPGAPTIGRKVKDLQVVIPDARTRIVAIFRHGNGVTPNGDTVIEVGDEVLYAIPSKNIFAVMGALHKVDKPYKKIILAGGGHIGKRIALALQDDYRVKIIEKDSTRASRIAAELENTIVLYGDASDRDLLMKENIEDTDVFCAFTDRDEANILSSMLAKRLGVRQTICVINQPVYADLIEGGLVDIAMSPHEATIGSILRYIRRGDVSQVYAIRRGAAEALEAVVHGDAETSGIVGRRIDKIDLPQGVVLGAIVRNEEVLRIHHDTVVESGDHVIMFMLSKKLVPAVEKKLLGRN